MIFSAVNLIVSDACGTVQPIESWHLKYCIRQTMLPLIIISHILRNDFGNARYCSRGDIEARFSIQRDHDHLTDRMQQFKIRSKC